METKVNYTMVGLFVIVLATVLVLAGFWIAQIGTQKSYNTYAVVVKQAVAGLSVRAPVKYNGVTVGYVDKIILDRHDPTKVHLLLSIEEDTPVTESTTATLMEQGITGVSYIGLRALTSNAPPLRAAPGQPYPVIQWTPSILVELDDTLREAFGNFKAVSNSINQLLNNQNQKSIQESLANISSFTNTLVANSKQFDQILQNSSEASGKLAPVLQQLQETLMAVNTATDHLSEVSTSANSTLRDSKVLIQNFSQQTLPSIQEAIDRLTGVLTTMQQLTTQLQTNPSMLVRGAQPKPLGPGER